MGLIGMARLDSREDHGGIRWVWIVRIGVQYNMCSRLHMIKTHVALQKDEPIDYFWGKDVKVRKT